MQSIIYVEGKSSPPVFDSENENLKIVNESQVDSLPNAVFEQLEVIDLLEFFDDDSILEKILSKLRHGGKIKITGNDAIQVLNGASNGSYNLEQASKLILDGRKRLISANQLKSKLSSLGLNVTLLGIVGSRYTLEAQRQ